ncbi:MAG: hypothetical protein H6Q90_6565, partial [Deltaproteobacteria bacterium]|nr:hypothetical protein [Deltaproteobacteria bacterium]
MDRMEMMRIVAYGPRCSKVRAWIEERVRPGSVVIAPRRTSEIPENCASS